MKREIVGFLISVMGLIVLVGCQNPAQDTPKNTNANLSVLTVSSGTLSPAFDSAATTYSVNVANNITSITVTGTPADTNASVDYNPAQPLTLSVGANIITVTVIAQDGTTIKDYVVTVTRATPANTNANLSTLTVSSGTLSPTFDSATTAYSVNVANNITSITVTGISADTNATVDYSPTQPSALNVGSNTITVSVTAEDGTTIKDYIVSVSRAALSPFGTWTATSITLGGGTSTDVTITFVQGGTFSETFTVGSDLYSLTGTFSPSDMPEDTILTFTIVTSGGGPYAPPVDSTYPFKYNMLTASTLDFYEDVGNGFEGPFTLYRQ